PRASQRHCPQRAYARADERRAHPHADRRALVEHRHVPEPAPRPSRPEGVGRSEPRKSAREPPSRGSAPPRRWRSGVRPMTRNKKPTASLVRSSAAEYLTFVAASGTGGVEAVHADENVWLSQKMMAQLYDVEVPTINYHLKKVFEDSELEEGAVLRSFR